MNKICILNYFEILYRFTLIENLSPHPCWIYWGSDKVPNWEVDCEVPGVLFYYYFSFSTFIVER